MFKKPQLKRVVSPFRVVETPWRYKYIVSSVAARSNSCFFCEYIQDPGRDRENLVFFRGKYSIGLLNRYPYTWGHVMVAPYRHLRDLAELSPEELAGLIRETYMIKRAVASLTKCQDILMGVNVGRAAGAGVEAHVHIHIIPTCQTIDPDIEPDRLEELLREYRDKLSRLWS